MLRLIVLAFVILCTGCASMFSGTTQNLLLRSDVKGTKLYLNNEEVGTDTATVQIAKKNLKNAVLIAKKPGCTDYSTHVNTVFDPTSLLGILIDFGLISILVVDWGITGAVNEAEKTNYLLNPTCS
jgi:hypothetical protein